jgi:hypothetical protein
MAYSSDGSADWLPHSKERTGAQLSYTRGSYDGIRMEELTDEAALAL